MDEVYRAIVNIMLGGMLGILGLVLFSRLAKHNQPPTQSTDAEDAARAWAQRNGYMIGRPPDILHQLMAQGWVILRPDAWQQLTQVLDKTRQPTVREWIEREGQQGGS